jgi:hypothetical protein
MDSLRLLTQGDEWFKATKDRQQAGWYLHVGGTKTERKASQARMFQLWDDGSVYVPMKAYAAYVEALGRVGLRLEAGYQILFREVIESEEGSYSWGAQSSYAVLNRRFRTWADSVGIPASVTLQSSHGSHTANFDALGVPREDICIEMAWMESMRAYYVDGRPVLGLESLVGKVALAHGTN